MVVAQLRNRSGCFATVCAASALCIVRLSAVCGGRELCRDGDFVRVAPAQTKLLPFIQPCTGGPSQAQWVPEHYGIKGNAPATCRNHRRRTIHSVPGGEPLPQTGLAATLPLWPSASHEREDLVVPAT